MSKPIIPFKKGVVSKDNKNVESFEGALAALEDCHCFAAGCCPCPFFKLDDISGSGDDVYFWNDAGVITSGTKAEFESACAGGN